MLFRSGYGLIQFFLLPMSILSMMGYAGNRDGSMGTAISSVLLSAAEWAGPLGLGFGCLGAMALFSYLMNSRSAGMIHALPIRREGLFLTNWLSGLSFFLLPNGVVCLIALAVEGAYGGLWLGLTLRWFVLHTVIAMFFFCFAVCCAMFTGHILALPVFYGVLNGLVAGLSLLVDNAMDVLLVGYDGNSAFSSTLTRWCTPLWHLMWKISEVDRLDSGAYQTAQGTTIALGYCLVLGAAFTLIAVVAYQHRQLERAGDVVTIGWARPIFQWGVGVCVGLLFGTVLFENFFRRQGAWAFVALVVLFTVLGAFVARMFLKKTLRVFAEGWKGCMALGLAMALLLGGARADLFGYQKWTPDLEAVESVCLGNMSSSPYDSGRNDVELKDPELIAEAIALHGALVKELDWVEKTGRSGALYSTTPEGWETSTGAGLRLGYRMKDGSFESRWYTGIPITQEALETPGTYAARLEALLNRPEVQRERYLGWMGETELTAASGWLTHINGVARELPDGTLSLTAQQAGALWEAFLEDLDAGRIHCYLLDGRERMENCYYTDINFGLNFVVTSPETGNRETHATDLTVTVQKSASSMLAVLEKEGLKDLLVSREEEKFPETHPG